ncbi:gliding motility-associated C-terminal domain-containing protein [Ferruginibacter sp. HRS2-29]|uniref:T9SS type B sorting domain-containing protein n=1 Tax=Ferruginibacter sp. HRS2-29 TaxID=2487334 RepID=UPI0020CC4AB5|nr:gliding motility-associated C-terminal domain-containing protein [Ferruginibacter sp. HRS2-29]MCP9750189.1 PKD domain-containing protein [Ferruginibacter sp. HRS2-29]
MKLFLLICTFLFALSGNAQNFTNKGKEFWVGYGHNQLFATNAQDMVIYLSATEAANVTVSVNGTSWVRNYSIPANTAIPTDLLPKTGPDDCRITAEGLSTKGIHIVSDVPIVAYVHVYGQYTSGATMLIPVETYSYTFFSVNPEQNASDSYSWFYVVANENNTTIRITPSRPTVGGHAQNVPFTVNLNKGEIYNVMGAINGSTGYDLSGSKVQSLPGADGICHPVGMFSGSSRTLVCSVNPFSGGSDFVMQQVFPINAWGNKYITALTSQSASPSLQNNNKFRVYIREPNTLVRKNGVLLTGLINNFFYDFVATTNDVITSTKPVLMAQFIPSASGCGTQGLGDPEMFILSPVEQAINKVVFYNTNKEAIQVNYLTLVIPQNGLSSLLIDGSNTFDRVFNHPNAPGYSVVVKQLPVTPAQHTATSDSNFTAITYGLGQYESYGYNAGTNLRNLESNIQVKNLYGTALTGYSCPGTPFKLVFKTTYRPSSILWHISAVAGLSSNADVLQNNYPVPTDSVVEFQRKFYLYELPGNYTFNTTGSYSIPVTLNDQLIENCSFSTELNIPVGSIPGPDADFSISPVLCVNKPITFTGTSSATIFPNKWLWTFGDATIDSVKVATKTYTIAGDYNVNLTAVRTDGCIGTAQKPVTILPESFSTINQSICEGQSYLGYTVTGTYRDTLAAVNGCDSIRILNLTVRAKTVSTISQSICEGQSYEGYSTPGTYADVFTGANGCDSTRILNLTVKLKQTSIFNQSICEGQSFEGYSASGTYVDVFTGTNGCDSTRTLNLTVKPKQTTTINQSICQGQTYLGYSATGTYTDIFTGTNGCDSTRILNLTVNQKQTVTINQSICQGQTYSGYSATGTYTDIFTGTNGCDSTRILNLTVNQKQTVTINQSICQGQTYSGYSATGTYTDIFTGDNGCDSTRILNLTVNQKQTVTINQSICQGQTYLGYSATGTYVDVFTAANGCDSTRTLNLTVNARSFTTIHQSICDGQTYLGYSISGTYVDNFTAANGCDSIRTLNLTVNPKKVSAITHSICAGDTYLGYSATGVYTDHFTAANGCDSARTLHLTVKAKAVSAITQSICAGSSYAGYSVSGTYVDHFTAANGCDSTRTLILTVKAKVSSSITQNICEGQSYLGYSTSGTYTDHFTSTGGCDSTRTLKLTVLAKPSPSLGADKELCGGETLTLSPGTFSSYLWQDNSTQPSFIVRSAGTYFVTVTNSCGSATDQVKISAGICNPYFPNAFTPNNDTKNDVFRVLYTGQLLNYNLQIFNRYGIRVFQSTTQSKGWNGTLNGQPADPGGYTWICSFTKGGVATQLKGIVLLIR